MSPIFGWVAAVLAMAPAVFILAVHRYFRVGRRVERDNPGRLGLHWRSVTISTANRRSLHGWLIPGGTADAPLVIVMHGWGGNAGCMLPLAPLLNAEGLGVLLLDARGHGRSDADGFSSLPKFAEDIDCAIDWVRRRLPVPRRIGLLGHSVGGAAVLLAASRRDDVDVVASIGSFAHPKELMARQLAGHGLGWPPLVGLVLAYVEWRIGANYEDIAPLNTIGRIRVPVLLAHGEKDRRVPVDDAHRLHRRSGPDGRLLLLPGVGHDPGRVLTSDPSAIERLTGFLRTHLLPEVP